MRGEGRGTGTGEGLKRTYACILRVRGGHGRVSGMYMEVPGSLGTERSIEEDRPTGYQGQRKKR